MGTNLYLSKYKGKVKNWLNIQVMELCLAINKQVRLKPVHKLN